MSRHKQQAKIVWMAIIALVMGALIATTGTTIAEADPSPSAWPKVLDNVALGANGTILTSPDGSFTVPNCSYETYSTVNMETFTSNTLTKYPKPAYNNPTIALCLAEDAVGIDGTVYAGDRTYSGGYKKIAAYKNGIKLWASPWQSAPGCTSPTWNDSNYTIGADGDLYVLQENNSCSGAQVYLMGINAQTGNVRFRSAVGSNIFGMSGGYLFAHQNGLVVRDGSTGVKYFDYSGVLQDSYTIPLTPGESVKGNFAVDFNGTVSASLGRERTNDPADLDCARNYAHARVLRRKTTGVVQDIRLTGPGSIGECLGLILKASPNGLAIRAVDFTSMPYNKLLFIEDDGTVLPVTSISNAGFNLNTYYNAFSVDSTGDVLVERTVYTNYTYDPQVQLLRYSDTGTLLSTFSTTSIAVNSTDRFVPAGWGEGDIPLLPESALLTVCKSSCSSTNLETVHKIPFSGLGMDYPRSAIFDAIDTAQGEQLNYVALGDSFSSGEGVPGTGFIQNTDTAGPPENRCHRSPDAYSMVLDRDPSLDLNLQSFRACSGAELDDVIVAGQWNEVNQISSLSEDTDVVTVTASGNDALFGAVIFMCLTDWFNGGGSNDCGDYINSAQSQVASLQASLDTAYSAIASKVGQQTRVLVVGYPHILPIALINPTCSGLAYHPQEMIDIYDLTSDLNQLIKARAEAAGFEFVDVYDEFVDHPLCQSGSYFNGVDLGNPEYSYHPNADGQAAYAQAIKNHLS